MTAAPVGRVRLATRGSPQALTQAGVVAEALTAATGRATELVPISTTGDRHQSVALHTIGGQGVFVKEVQQAVLDGRADLAVHSAKDLPSDTPTGLVIGAFCARRDAADALVGRALADLAAGATVATGSVRRRAQLIEQRPDLTFVELRGNIARRLEQVPPSGAVVVAVAALDVLGLLERIAERLDPDRFVPAVGQGCVAVECRADDPHSGALLAAVDHAPTRHAVTVERAFLHELGSGCSLPIGAHCTGARLDVFLAGESGAAFRERVDVGDITAVAARRAAELARRAHESVTVP
jgi:hydroxymethylbilane synthase